MYKHFFKRLLDILVSAITIVLLALPMGIIACVIKKEDPGPALFKQKRVGQHKRLFSIYKFRSMRLDTPKDVPTHLLDNPEQYLLKSGRFLRKSSLDELPQLFNIIKGDMSIIGPRPALWNQDDLIRERDRYGANDVVPGLTGWAQVHGRDELEIPVKAKLDGEYTKNLSFAMDVRCFILTLKSVFKGSGVVEGGTGTLNKEHDNDVKNDSAPLEK
ncbi:MAG: sugar transferase [Clostridiaceae bacterium]|jgi:O-antigen biosynthesis protein WbqP|nr:sugar transferase [Clostridiaceae bacterium]